MEISNPDTSLCQILSEGISDLISVQLVLEFHTLERQGGMEMKEVSRHPPCSERINQLRDVNSLNTAEISALIFATKAALVQCRRMESIQCAC